MTLEALISAVPAWITATASRDPSLAYLAISVAMVLETVVAPIPAELIMPLAGVLVAQGHLALGPVLFAGLLGSVLGAWFWYGVGRMVNHQRLERWLQRRGRWLGLKPELLETSRRWFLRHGMALVFWGRLVPGVRTWISVPAGIELMSQRTFLSCTAAGSLIWILVLTLGGQALGRHGQSLQAALAQLALVPSRLSGSQQAGVVAGGLLVLAAAALLLIRFRRGPRPPAAAMARRWRFPAPRR